MPNVFRALKVELAKLSASIGALRDQLVTALLRFALGIFLRILRKYDDPNSIVQDAAVPINGRFTDKLLIYPPPYTLPGVQMFGFVFEGETKQIEAFCNDKLNFIRGSRDFDYRPISNRILITVNYAPKIMAGGQARDYGWFSYNEVTFWLPVMKWSLLKKWENTPTFFIPLGFVDNQVAISGGREVYGFPKQWGQITLPHLHDPIHDDLKQQDMNFRLDILALKTHSPDTQATMETLFEIKLKNPKTDALSCEPEHMWEDDDRKTAAELKRVLATKDLDIDFGSFLPNIPILLLKEFRDVTNPSGICYQSITGMDGTFTQLKAARLTGTYEGVFTQLASHPIVEQFGMKPKQDAQLGFWIYMDMELGFGKSVWQFPVKTAEQQARTIGRLASLSKAEAVKKGRMYRTR
ncbi:MAG: hypothetical protein GC179_31525 [Anaerolineaceae bacterium]|nr:hypothetical protein [Anaerolineaceae bacterium]